MTQVRHTGARAASSDRSQDRALAKAMGFSILALSGLGLGLSDAPDARMIGLVAAFAAMLTVSACLGSRLAKGFISRGKTASRRNSFDLETWR